MALFGRERLIILFSIMLAPPPSITLRFFIMGLPTRYDNKIRRICSKTADCYLNLEKHLLFLQNNLIHLQRTFNNDCTGHYNTSVRFRYRMDNIRHMALKSFNIRERVPLLNNGTHLIMIQQTSYRFCTWKKPYIPKNFRIQTLKVMWRGLCLRYRNRILLAVFRNCTVIVKSALQVTDIAYIRT